MSAITSPAPTSGPASGTASGTITGSDSGWPTAMQFGCTATSFTIESAAQGTAIALP